MVAKEAVQHTDDAAKSIIKKNASAGKQGDQIATEHLKEKFGKDATVVERVTADFKDGKRTVFDNVIVDAKTGKVLAVNETKTGGAKLTKGQSRYYEQGESVKFVGDKADAHRIKGVSIDAKTTDSYKTTVDLKN